MMIRVLLIVFAAFLIVPCNAQAQGARSKREIVVSPSALKMMAAQKPKSKSPLTSRFGIAPPRNANIVATKPAAIQPTSVRAIHGK